MLEMKDSEILPQSESGSLSPSVSLSIGYPQYALIKGLVYIGVSMT